MALPDNVVPDDQTHSHFASGDFFKQFGPAWLVMMADVDAGSIIGGAQTGAIFGYSLIWLYILLIFPLFIVLELAGRISIATQKGLGSVIRENYGKNMSILMTFPMAITDVATYAIEYIGIAVGLEIVGFPLYLAIPSIYVVHILLVTKRKYVKAEKLLIMVSLFLLFSFMATLYLRGLLPAGLPDTKPVQFHHSSIYFFLIAANVGAVVMPFMIFFQASATGIKSRELNLQGPASNKRASLRIMRKETLLGAIVTEMLMIMIEMTFTGVKNASNSNVFATASQLGSALTPIAGRYSIYIFGIGLMSASFVALVVISLASAWGLAETLKMKKDSVWVIYVIESFPAMIAAMLIPSGLMISITLYLLVFFVIVLIGPMMILGVIGKNRSIMGELVSGNRYQYIYWATFVIVILTALISFLY